VRLRTEIGAIVVRMAAALLLLLVLWAPVSARVQTAARTARPLEQAEIDRALETVKKDPNLATHRTVRMLQWKDADKPPPKKPSWWTWISDLFRWFDRSARVLIWVTAFFLAALLISYIIRLASGTGDAMARDGTAFVAPSHVRDVDIRPESLPADIGAAARVLWDRGARRAALALLYRGMLSRFAHVHRIPIRDSSTEGDCLALAASHLPAPKVEYSERLVGEWQRVVYGRQDTQTEIIHGLCDGFAAALDRAASADPVGSSA
jgi:hypothetical protein